MTMTQQALLQQPSQQVVGMAVLGHDVHHLRRRTIDEFMEKTKRNKVKDD